MQVSRRTALQTLAVAAAGPLVACTTTPSPTDPSGSPAPVPSSPSASAGPRGEVEAVIFDGAFGLAHVQQAADLLHERYPAVVTTIAPVVQVAETLAPRFEDGEVPPDLIDNSGTDPLAVAEMPDAFLPLDDVIASPSADGSPISETLYHGVLEPGTFNDTLLAINYALTVYGLWYSAAAFASQGWAVPNTWDAMLELGELARSNDAYLFVWGTDAATYYQELAITSAIKEGGHDVRIALDNLDENGWAHPAVTQVLAQLESCVREGYVLAGGEYLAAQAEWSHAQRALLYPSGAWIAREMDKAMAEGFEMTAAPVPTLTSSPKLTPAAIHSTATEPFLVPRAARNPEGAKALLGMLLSTEVAQEFSRTNLVPSVVRNSVPSDIDSTALSSQTRMLADAGDDVFTWRFSTHYGLVGEQNELWAQFLSGSLNAAHLAEKLQALSDRVRNDPSVEHYTVS